MLEPAFASRLFVTALVASESAESDFSIADAFLLFCLVACVRLLVDNEAEH